MNALAASAVTRGAVGEIRHGLKVARFSYFLFLSDHQTQMTSVDALVVVLDQFAFFVVVPRMGPAGRSRGAVGPCGAVSNGDVAELLGAALLL